MLDARKCGRKKFDRLGYAMLRNEKTLIFAHACMLQINESLRENEVMLFWDGFFLVDFMKYTLSSAGVGGNSSLLPPGEPFFVHYHSLCFFSWTRIFIVTRLDYIFALFWSQTTYTLLFSHTYTH